MPFGLFESSRGRGQPITLYNFRYGTAPNAFFAYTDADEPVTFNGVEYLPVPISRGNIQTNGTLDKAALEVRVQQDSPVADLFKVYPPSQVVNLTIRQGHAHDETHDFLVAWTGRVLSCSWEQNEAKFSCEPVSTMLRRTGLRRHYQYGCPHVLYGPECRASKPAATVTRTIVSISGYNLTMQGGWAAAATASSYVGGMVEWDGANGLETRTILGVSGDVLRLSGPPRGLESGDDVRVILGCARNMTACLIRHNNVQNYGGQPWIPLKNPVGRSGTFS